MFQPIQLTEELSLLLQTYSKILSSLGTLKVNSIPQKMLFSNFGYGWRCYFYMLISKLLLGPLNSQANFADLLVK